MKVNGMREKIEAFLFGAFILFVVVESFLQVTAFFHFSPTSQIIKKPHDTKSGNSNIRILCLGNSHTTGSTLGRDRAYPAFLQKKLNREHSNKSFFVVNRGVSNLNTAELLQRIDELIGNTRPDLVILRIGEANLWNHYNYNSFLRRSEGSNIIEKEFHSFYDLMYNFRTFRFLSVMYSRYIFSKNFEKDVTNKNTTDATIKYPKGFKESKKWYDGLISEWRESNASIKKKIDFKKFQENLRVFKTFLRENPQNPKGYRYLGRLYYILGDESKAAEFYMRGIEAAPKYRQSEENKNYAMIRWLKYQTDNRTLIERIDKFQSNLSKEKPASSTQFVILNRSQILSWVNSDLEKILEELKEKDVEVVIHNYHPRPPGKASEYLRKYMRQLNQILKEKAEENNYTFVNNYKAFKERLEKGTDPRKLYLEIGGNLDSHPSTFGQNLTSREIFKTLERLEILNKPTKRKG